MYIGNARTLQAILSQLSDTDTFSEQRDQLLAKQQHRSFRFVLRFTDADNSFGYATNHPLYNGYTVNGKLIDSNQQVRVSFDPKTNPLIESLRTGDTLEVIASLHRWDPAYNVVEMETVSESIAPQKATSPANKNSTPEETMEAADVVQKSPPLIEKPTVAIRPSAGKQTNRPTKTTSAGRSLTRWFTLLGCLGCLVTASLIFTYSSSAAGWAETPAKLVYYRAKNRQMFITYVYTVEQTEYRRTEPANEAYGAAGNYLWVVYQEDNPHTAEVSKRRRHNNVLTIFTIGPLLLIFLVGGWIVVVQILRAPNIAAAPKAA